MGDKLVSAKMKHLTDLLDQSEMNHNTKKAQLAQAYQVIQEMHRLINEHRQKAGLGPLEALPEATTQRPEALDGDQTTYLEAIKNGISGAWSAITGAASSAITKAKGVVSGCSPPTPDEATGETAKPLNQSA